MMLKKSPYFLGFLLVVLAGVVYWNMRGGEAVAPVLDDSTRAEAVSVVNQVVEYGHRRKWKEFGSLWVKPPQDREVVEVKRFFGRGFKHQFELQDSVLVDPAGESMRLIGSFEKGRMGRIILRRKDGQWRIESAQLY